MPSFDTAKNTLPKVLPQALNDGLNGVTAFFAGQRMRSWLLEALQKSNDMQANFVMDYTVRISVDEDGTAKVRLLAQPGGARQLQLWSDE